MVFVIEYDSITSCLRHHSSQRPKSATAADAVKKMNATMHVSSATNRVGTEKKKFQKWQKGVSFDNFLNFFSFLGNFQVPIRKPSTTLVSMRVSMEFVMHSITSKQEDVRRRERKKERVSIRVVDLLIDVDSRCVLFGKSLLESGTLGSKGNVQVNKKKRETSSLLLLTLLPFLLLGSTTFLSSSFLLLFFFFFFIFLVSFLTSLPLCFSRLHSLRSCLTASSLPIFLR